MFIVCGYNLDDAKIAQLEKFLDDKKVEVIDLKHLLLTLTYLKELEL